ncbi:MULTISPECIES: hypothetical protein [unclassified Pseudomonas]|uniref:hypothetical protein n=1 Tax=unclassified Pseudomonas TaxID=196821 RepID=UPI002097BFA6|nr:MULTISPECIES: hypothetical protein [unclassified Pseudomonas]MCO7503156.1 hypothetical protein [Pseudomonas sp. VE 267-6A]MCO7532434.1 hypothetical protein [Pseudomonas sp. 2]
MSNTEQMVSFPRELTDDLAELIAEKARVCGGGAVDIWDAICAHAQPAAQHQGEPVALPERKSYEESFSVHGQGQIMGWNAYHDEIAKLGPLYTHPAPVQQGEPVAWRGINELGEVVTEWIDGVPPERMVDLRGNPGSFAKIELAYSHVDAGEVERLHELSVTNILMAITPGIDGMGREHYAQSVGEVEQKLSELMVEVDTLRASLESVRTSRDAFAQNAIDLRAQLAERDALLRIVREQGLNPVTAAAIRIALSASAEPIPFPGYPPVPEDRKLPAEPSAPVERDELEAEAQRIYESWSDQRGYVPWVARGNSLKQDEARRQARAALERKPSGDIPDFTPGSGNKVERRATELVAQLQADLTERDQRLDQFQQVMQKVATLRGTLDLHGIREEVEALLWPDLHSRPEERGTPETEPCSGCGTPGWTGACAKCVPY